VRLDKRILRSRAAQNLTGLIAAVYIRFVYLTSRWTVIGGDIPEKFWNENKIFLLCFWHGRLFMLPRSWNLSKPLYIMASMHRDGRLISDTVNQFGIKTIAGSTSKGGAMALRAMLKKAKGGEYVGITPDGPRGPRMRAQEGVVTLARLAKIPVIPVSCASSRSKILGSWDRFIVALPFGRGVFVWGEPITVPHTADETVLEAARKEIEDSLNAISAQADTLCGHTPILPAEETPS
jgi:lysophospholipid acyltransferase (LPLAT)-like uncharacterized protein